MTKQPADTKVQSLRSENPGMWAIDDAFGSQLANLTVNGIQHIECWKSLLILPHGRSLIPMDNGKKSDNRYAFVSVIVVEQESADVFTFSRA